MAKGDDSGIGTSRRRSTSNALTPDRLPSTGNDAHADWSSSNRTKAISDDLGVRMGAANAMATALASYTNQGYGDITEAQRNGDTTSRAGKMGVRLQQLVDAAEGAGRGWDGGPTYRGMYLSDDAYSAFMDGLSGGGSLGILEGYTSSWTTDPSVAASYAGAGKSMLSGHSNPIVFVHERPEHKGVSVMGISNAPERQRKWEKEVLCSAKSSYTLKGYEIGRDMVGNKVTYVYVDSD